jgi:hypothetical protein
VQRTTFQKEAAGAGGGRNDLQEAASLLHTFLSTRQSFAQQTKNYYLFLIEKELFYLPRGEGNKMKVFSWESCFSLS